MIDFYHKPDNTPEYYDIISTCVFIMKKSYKSTLIYQEGLENLLKVIQQTDKYLYLYHDRTIEEPKHLNEDINEEIKSLWIPLIDKLKKSKRVFLIRYEFPEFKEDKFYHHSTFGTIVRFLPIFDLPEYKKTRIVYCTDLDSKIAIFYMITQKIDYLRKNKNIDIYFRTHTCYNLKFWVFIQRLKNITNFRIIGSSFCTNRIKFSYKYFTEFLNDVLRNKNNELKDIVRINNNIHKDIKCSYKFCYGYDEYFLNKYILYDIVKNGYHFIVNLWFNTSRVFSYVMDIFTRETKDGSILNNNQKKILKQIMTDYNFKESFTNNYNNFKYSIKVEEFLKIAKKLEKENKLKVLFMTKLELDCLSRAEELYEKHGYNHHLFSIGYYDSNLVLHKRWINNLISR